jgi:hypothetical protein
MDLTLNKVGHDYFEPVELMPFSCETTRENIVPDSCPDIARIVETTGTVCVTSRELTGDGRICASGNVDAAVLYIPERGEGPCALHFQLPFQCYGEGAQEGEGLDVRGELESIDTRALNPRKVLTRANITLYPSLCRPASMSVCTDVAEEASDLQLLREKRETQVIAGIREKEFTFSEELSLSPGRGAAEEILSTALDIRGTDSKLIGNKLVVKGLVAVSVLYRESGGRLEVLRQELPFSQILEGIGFREDCVCQAVFRQTAGECRLGGAEGAEDNHLMTLTVTMRTVVTVWQREEVAWIGDLYSTAVPVSCQTGEITLREEEQRQSLRQNARQLLETGVAVKSVVDTQLLPGRPRLSGDGGQVELPLWGRVLYYDENDSLHAVEKSFTAACPLDQAAGYRVEASQPRVGDVMVSILPDGVELRSTIECDLTLYRLVRHACVTGGERLEEEQGPTPPSLILRKLGGEEALWSVAKRYRTTCGAILEVNGLTDESQIHQDKLLLIPRAK